MKHRRKKIGLIWLAVFAGVMSGATAGAFLALTRDLPQIQALESFRPSAVTRVYSADQVLLAELFLEKRDPVPLARIPRNLITALLTTEDRSFYQHSGLYAKGILRASIKNLLKGRYAEGASTLTQQLAKTLFLSPRKTIVRKLREAILALQLERRYTKDEILELYLNQIYLGSGAYGVASAAHIYFGKKVEDLTLAECALIAGLPRAPTRYSPLTNPEMSLKRRNLVLSLMKTTGAIDQATFQKAVKEPLSTPPATDGLRKSPYFIDYVKATLEAAIGADRLYKGGLTVYTTLSDQLQTAAKTAVANGLIQLDRGMEQDRLAENRPQAALVALDISSGGILSMVGGRGESQIGYNRAITARRQPGSAFKPVVYALAVERGFEQNQILLDAPVVFHNPALDQDWQPEDFSQTYEGEISLRWALAHSKNIPAVRLIEKLGPSAVVQFAHALGISSKLRPDLTLALGTSEVSLLEMTAAYAVFANRGRYVAPFGVAEVLDTDGKIIWQTKPEQRIVMSRTGAAITTDMLEAVIQEGTGRAAHTRLPGPLAGKTGTTNDFKDALFIGYSPAVATGVWVGNDDASTLGPRETGARAALPIWIEFMQQALKGQSQNYFDIPDDVQQKYIQPRSGAETSADAAGAVRALTRRSQPLAHN